MNKIAVISTVKNEADIIEHFVRHCLSFADMVLIMDHDSCDRTGDILQCLQAENKRLITYRSELIGHEQSKIMTSLMHEATLRYGANIVVPLDADEFILSNSDKTIRDAICGLPANTVYKLPLVWYRMDDSSLLENKFILSVPGKRLDKLGGAKVFVTPGDWQWESMMLGQGNHHVLQVTKDGWTDIVPSIQNELYIAHFVRRSYEQQVSKFVVGWIHNVAKYSKYCTSGHGWGKNFNAFLNGTYIPDEELPIVQEYGSLLRNYIPIKYSNESKIDPFRNLQITAEKMANKVALYECLLAGNKADVVLLECYHTDACILSLMSVRRQGYAVDRVFIISASSDTISKIREIFSDLHIIFLDDISQIVEQSRAGYVQFMYAGDEMRPEKISMAMTAIYQYPDVGAIYFNGIDISEKGQDMILNQETSMPYISGTGFVAMLRRQKLILSGGLVGFLFKRNIVGNINWFKDYQLDDKYLYWIAICHMLLQCNNVAVISDKVVKSVAGTVEYTIPYGMQIDAI